MANATQQESKGHEDDRKFADQTSKSTEAASEANDGQDLYHLKDLVTWAKLGARMHKEWKDKKLDEEDEEPEPEIDEENDEEDDEEGEKLDKELDEETARNTKFNRNLACSASAMSGAASSPGWMEQGQQGGNRQHKKEITLADGTFESTKACKGVKCAELPPSYAEEQKVLERARVLRALSEGALVREAVGFLLDLLRVWSWIDPASLEYRE